MKENLKLLKYELRILNKVVFDIINRCEGDIILKISELDKMEEEFIQAE